MCHFNIYLYLDSELRFKLLNVVKVFKSKLHELEQVNLTLKRRSGTYSIQYLVIIICISITGQKELILRNKDEITLLEKMNDKRTSQIKSTHSSSVPLSMLAILID